MSSECGICQHDHRETIDIALAVPDASQRKIAKAWGISRDAVRRHVAHGHVPGVPATSKKAIPDKAVRHRRVKAGEARVLPAPTPEGEIDEALPPPPDLPPVIRPAKRNMPDPAARTTPPVNSEEWIRVLADTIFLGKYKGRETVLGIAARTGESIEEVQRWADEAASVVSRSWGSSELQLQASLAEWRALRLSAKEAKDDARAADCQKQIDRILQSQIKQAKLRDRLRKSRGDITALRSHEERRRYLAKLIRTGVFGRAAVSQQIQICWGDLSPLEFTELVAQAADDVRCRRGTQQARRLTLLGRVDRIYERAIHSGDLKTALRCVETEARLDGLGNETDLLTGLAMSTAWRIAAQTLQAQFPEALAMVHAALTAEEARKRQALAPASVVESEQAT
jgi:hypothetical protein